MKRAGFTLIEVMVSTTILLLMTVMMGSLFRQATSTWDAGNAQAEGGMIVRGVVGAITRDMATAVDARAYGKQEAFTCNGSSLSFVCLKPVKTSGNATAREPHLVTYTVGSTVRRTDAAWNASSSSFGSAENSVLYDGSSSGFAAEFSLEAVALPPASKTNPSSSDSDRSGFDENDWLWNGPASVKVRLRLTQDGTFSGLRVRSWGPNGHKGPSDDEDDEDNIVAR